METKHTPGPWHVGMKPGPIVYGTRGEMVADCRLVTNTEEENAENARLIAAAPDLLDVCEAIAALNEGQGRDNLCEVAGWARQVIAKAKL